MGRWIRDRLLIVVGLMLVGSVGMGSVWAYRLPSAERGDAFALLGIVVGLASALAAVAALGRRPAGSRAVDVLVDSLAQAVYGQWHKAANERRLLTPEPIPIHWSLSTLAVTGPVTAAVGTPGTPPAFPPLPGHCRTTEADLQAGGGRGELHALYAGLASGRIIVVGAPGAGKTGAAVLLLLDALAHRDHLDDTERVRTPVPVLFTTHGREPAHHLSAGLVARSAGGDLPLVSAPRRGCRSRCAAHRPG